MVRYILICLLLLCVACARPASPPATRTPLPTLAPPTASPEPSATPAPTITRTPTLTPTVTMTPLPEERPVVRDAQPAPDSEVPAGEVRVSAEVAARSSLAQVTITLNALPVRVELQEQDFSNWTASVVRKLNPGDYEARLTAMDDQRRIADYRWRFRVLPEPTPTPTITATPTPSPTFSPTQTPLVLATPSNTPVAPAAPTAPITPVTLATLAGEIPPAGGASAAPSGTVPPAPNATPTPIRLPLVRGMRAPEARAQLQRLGFEVQLRQVSSPAPRDIVVDQSPADGTPVTPGASVTLSVSSGR